MTRWCFTCWVSVVSDCVIVFNGTYAKYRNMAKKGPCSALIKKFYIFTKIQLVYQTRSKVLRSLSRFGLISMTWSKRTTRRTEAYRDLIKMLLIFPSCTLLFPQCCTDTETVIVYSQRAFSNSAISYHDLFIIMIFWFSFTSACTTGCQ